MRHDLVWRPAPTEILLCSSSSKPTEPASFCGFCTASYVCHVALALYEKLSYRSHAEKKVWSRYMNLIMSSPEPCKETYTLTKLPLSILTRILRYVCPHNPFDRTNRLGAPFLLPFRDPPVTLALHCASTLTVQLPSELLPPALVSPVLATAAVNILGDRVSYLTHCNTGGQLSAWIKAFAPYVKAVSTEDPFPAWFINNLRGGIAQDWMSVFQTQLEHSIRLFKTLSIDGVMLEVLDLQDVHFLDLSNVEDDIMAGLCATLESNSGTLRELALPVFRTSDICDKALEMSHLKKLDVLTVKPWSMYVVNDSEALPPPVLRMIRAVDGHADRSRKLTTLRELRLLEVDSMAFYSLTASDRNSSVFLSIKTLRIVWLSAVYYSDGTEGFVSLFKNLERLFWNVNPGSSDMFFENLCTKVPEVHLCGYRWITMPAQVGAKLHSGEKCGFFGERSFDTEYGSGAIRSIYAGPMPGTELGTMMTSCPRLENLSVNVTRENIRVIRKVVAKCQQMKCLDLVFDERIDGPLEAGDWHAMSRVVPKSHKNLCQVAIQIPHSHARPITGLRGVDVVFGCFERVTKALGDRAKRLAFHVRFRTSQGAKLMERVCDLLNVCIQHTPALESLEIKPRMTRRYTSDDDMGWAKEVARRLIDIESRMLHEMKSLRMLHTGASPWLLRNINWNDDTLETDSTRSETEWTSPSS